MSTLGMSHRFRKVARAVECTITAESRAQGGPIPEGGVRRERERHWQPSDVRRVKAYLGEKAGTLGISLREVLHTWLFTDPSNIEEMLRVILLGGETAGRSCDAYEAVRVFGPCMHCFVDLSGKVGLRYPRRGAGFQKGCAWSRWAGDVGSHEGHPSAGHCSPWDRTVGPFNETWSGCLPRAAGCVELRCWQAGSESSGRFGTVSACCKPHAGVARRCAATTRMPLVCRQVLDVDGGHGQCVPLRASTTSFSHHHRRACSAVHRGGESYHPSLEVRAVDCGGRGGGGLVSKPQAAFAEHPHGCVRLGLPHPPSKVRVVPQGVRLPVPYSHGVLRGGCLRSPILVICGVTR